MSNLTRKLIQIFTALLVPLVLVLGTVRILATDAFLTFEYGRPGFPVDTYGFTTQQRFILASTNVHYVRAHLPDDELSKQTLNGKPVYNEREISHMADVQAVFQILLRVWQFAFVLLILAALILWKHGEYKTLMSGIRLGGYITSSIILLIGFLAAAAWNTWFETFHQVFFHPGSWLFSYTDSLIRLFPTQFWFDATLTLSFLSILGGLLVAFVGSRLQNVDTRPHHDVLASAH